MHIFKKKFNQVIKIDIKHFSFTRVKIENFNKLIKRENYYSIYPVFFAALYSRSWPFISENYMTAKSVHWNKLKK